MGVDLKGVVKDNGKLILSLVALVIVALLMGATSKQENGIFDFWNATDTFDASDDDISKPVVSDDDSEPNEGDSIPISNGKNNFYANEPPFDLQANTDYSADIMTNLGTINIDLYEDISPTNVNNFIFLSDNDFYKGTSFHRVIKDYLIQGGDPIGTGYGGPGYFVVDEIDASFRFKPYMVAMANSGSDANGSQFFIVSKRANTKSLDGLYTPIGEVTNGFNVIDAIEQVDVDGRYMPYEAVIIQDILIKVN